MTSCSDLCQYQPVATPSQTQCAAVQAELLGYPVTKTPECYGMTTVGKCVSCYGAVKASDANCAAIGATCLK